VVIAGHGLLACELAHERVLVCSSGEKLPCKQRHDLPIPYPVVTGPARDASPCDQPVMIAARSAPPRRSKPVRVRDLAGGGGRLGRALVAEDEDEEEGVRVEHEL
jgi:hypothetical protein